ncbi:hypothetical protein IEQ34_006258 [Dendrobium chrysotoxum]|uniref:Damage-control phosphatase ARMT1-like metal-binding domain-containing protein n=1 Tax=Dendrobium chrysotoxum TaxID=161865 RepID=A0AAV7GW92_DENCH|nr:hypothetical protein IEQ34_006258 [Dendrobium chrysotoxum]
MRVFKREDAYGWVYWVEMHLMMNGVTEEERLMATALCLERKALAWFHLEFESEFAILVVVYRNYLVLAEVFAKDGLSFLASCQNLVSRPWVIDDLDSFKASWAKKSWKKAIIFVDNSGADIVLGILPFARELLRRGTQVVLAANDLPSINDVTYPELVEIISKLKDEKGQLVGVDASGLLVVNSGNDLPVIDLANVSPELAYLASDADLVVLEGMGRSIETNLYAQMKCDSVKIGMVKHPEVAQFLGGRLYDCVFKYNEV